MTAVPIVVESTTDDYFVLYVSHDVDGTESELPVLVKRGEAGTTTLAENVEALSAERYRVERYLTTDPADVDGDCIDDITELGDPVGMSPVNSAPPLGFSDGAASMPDLETYVEMSQLGDTEVHSRVVVLDPGSERPGLAFINGKTHATHQHFLDAKGISDRPSLSGFLTYNSQLVAPGGSRGGWYVWISSHITFATTERLYDLMAANMPVLRDDLYIYVPAFKEDEFEQEREHYEASRIDVVFWKDLSPRTRVDLLNLGVGYGRLRVMDADGRPHPREVVIYEAVPNELPRVAGIITTVRQTPLSHVNLRAAQDGVPNAYIRDLLADPDITSLVGGFVRYEVAETGWSLRAATPEEVEEHYESTRPTQAQTPQRDLSVTSIATLSDVSFDDWTAFGVKAANVAELGRLGFPEGTVPNGFAIPFYFYDEFMKANGFHDRIAQMLADPDFQSDFDVQDDMLDDLRDDIEDAESPQWILDALTEMHESFPEGTSLRYRSSTNNEDLPGFNGAGLYDSKTQDPEETEEDGIDKSLKGVFASLWTFRAFTEREFHRIDHSAAAMGVLVHPNYSDEKANGVAVSFDPFYDGPGRYYVNTQLGEDLVTNPLPRSVPEELLLLPDGTYLVRSTSNLVERGELLMSDAQIGQLAQHLTAIHDHFKGLYNPGSGDPFAMEIEFKITSEDVLAIKQARPWVFRDEGVLNEAPTITGYDSPSFREEATGTVASYRAADPEGSAITWSVGGTDGDDFRISEAGALTFDSPPDYESPAGVNGNEYQVTVRARDDGGKTASFDVTVTVTPVDEPPAITGETTIHDYDENGTGDVATYTADDPEGDTNLTWTLGGTDRGDFSITGGVLRFAVAPDYERPADSGGNNHYEVIVEATDSNNNRGTRHVDLIVKNVDEPPELTGPDTIDNLPENSATSRQVGRFTASDPEGDRADLSLSSGGADFTLASNGVLTFKESPDYETQSSYTVTVRARVGSGISNTVNTVDKPVTVNIQNLEEPGTVTLSSVQPQAGTTLTATLGDDDGPTGTTWHWHRTSSRGSTGTAITNADSRFYTPGADDVGRYLRAVASYDDGHGTGKTATAVSANRVQAAPPDPEPPVFPLDGNYDRSIRENTPAGTNLGAPVRATDANNDRLTYSIPASDYFEIDAPSGQLRTKAELDHEGREQHFLTVTATDPGGQTDTVSVTITVEDVDETPVVFGPTSPEVAENGNTGVATYTAADPDNKGIEWVLTGSDSDNFTLYGGALTFNEVADYEEGNQYRVTIEAREQGDGTSVGRLSVTVRVSNVNEPGVLETNVEEPRVGQTVRLNVVDEDGGVNVRKWKWERGEPRGICGTVDSPTVATWEAIGGATSSSYTPAAADQGHCIRATAFYDDRAGTGRTEQFLTPVSVENGPFFTQDPPTYRVQENTAEGGDVGRVQARHTNNGETLTHRLGGSDDVSFTIDNDGRLKISATPLDYETQPGREAVVEITAEDSNGQSATITVAITVIDECASAGEPPCAPGRPGVSSASDTSLRVSWSTPGSPTGTTITGYDLQYRESDGGGGWIPQSVAGTDRAHTIESLIKGTTYEVQVRASNDGSGYGEWSQSGTGTPGYVPPPPPPPPPPIKETTTTTSTEGGGGGFVPPAPPQPPRPATNFQGVGQLFQPLTRNSTLGRVWRLIEASQRWLFYDPKPQFAPFNTLRTINLASDPPAVVAINVTRSQQFRGIPLYAGWNFVPVTAAPLPAQPGSGTQPVEQLFRPLAGSGALQRVWWLDSRTQEWTFYDPDPAFAAFNTLTTINLAANPPVVVAVSVSRQTEFRGRTLYRGWNYVVMR